MFRPTIALWLALWAPSAFAQAGTGAPAELRCGLLPLAPAERAARATLVVEAEVLDARAEWDAAHRRLYTRHRLRVFSLLKGAPADTVALAVLTEGGALGLVRHTLSNSLALRPGQIGMLFLYRPQWAGVAPGWAAYGSSQGFIAYDLATGTAAEPFRQYPALDAAFYAEQATLTGQPRRGGRAWPGPPTAARGGLAPTVAALLPDTVAAGVGAVLSLRGSGFGAVQGGGRVEFRNADDGGATRTAARAEDYLYWSDTLVRVRVPSSGSGGHPAGSGAVRLTTAGQVGADSPTPLLVRYALTNVEANTDQRAYRPVHVALNERGGLSFGFGPSFGADPAAVAAWRRALDQWRCRSGISWDAAATASTNAAAEDGQNAVAFAEANQLPANVLARTTSYYRGCYGPRGELQFRVSEVDMQFSPTITFNRGPAVAPPGQIDLESVTVHELGHAQQLAHLIRPGAIMHYALRYGQTSRRLDPGSDLAGGRRVLREGSFRRPLCGGTPLLPAPLAGLAATAPAGTPTLAWTTRDECFLTGFVLERSQGRDTTRWSPVLSLPAGSGPTYQARDPQPLTGFTYYRLGLRRPDGSTDYAAPLALSPDSGAPPSIFPNPATADEVALQLYATRATDLPLRLYDAVGRLILTRFVAVLPGLNVLPVSLPGLRPGTYLLVFADEEGTRRVRLARL